MRFKLDGWNLCKGCDVLVFDDPENPTDQYEVFQLMRSFGEIATMEHKVGEQVDGLLTQQYQVWFRSWVPEDYTNLACALPSLGRYINIEVRGEMMLHSPIEFGSGSGLPNLLDSLSTKRPFQEERRTQANLSAPKVEHYSPKSLFAWMTQSNELPAAISAYVCRIARDEEEHKKPMREANLSVEALWTIHYRKRQADQARQVALNRRQR
jgi:hypothetical protein